jgi:hypothetical protein
LGRAQEREHREDPAVVVRGWQESEFREDAAHVGFHRLLAHEEALSDRSVGTPFGHQREDLSLAAGKIGRRVRRAPPADQLRDHFGIDRGAALPDPSHSITEPTIAELQAQLDRFAVSYKTWRPHRALGRRTPIEAFVPGRRRPLPRGRSRCPLATGSGGTGSIRTGSSRFATAAGCITSGSVGRTRALGSWSWWRIWMFVW